MRFPKGSFVSVSFQWKLWLRFSGLATIGGSSWTLSGVPYPLIKLSLLRTFQWIRARIPTMLDVSEESRARAVARRSRILRHWHEILGAGEEDGLTPESLSRSFG